MVRISKALSVSLLALNVLLLPKLPAQAQTAGRDGPLEESVEGVAAVGDKYAKVAGVFGYIADQIDATALGIQRSGTLDIAGGKSIMDKFELLLLSGEEARGVSGMEAGYRAYSQGVEKVVQADAYTKVAEKLRFLQNGLLKHVEKGAGTLGAAGDVLTTIEALTSDFQSGYIGSSSQSFVDQVASRVALDVVVGMGPAVAKGDYVSAGLASLARRDEITA